MLNVSFTIVILFPTLPNKTTPRYRIRAFLTDTTLTNSLQTNIHTCFPRFKTLNAGTLPADSSPVVTLNLSLVTRGVWWEGGKRERVFLTAVLPSPPAPAVRVIRDDDWGRVSLSSTINRFFNLFFFKR